ncbi:MAG: hypothetical protein C0404_04485 [Verrucomicrobia bacterium]|nr:hypothetical protein [Verrucomicrobiota bacterium]
MKHHNRKYVIIGLVAGLFGISLETLPFMFQGESGLEGPIVVIGYLIVQSRIIAFISVISSSLGMFFSRRAETEQGARRKWFWLAILGLVLGLICALAVPISVSSGY